MGKGAGGRCGRVEGRLYLARYSPICLLKNATCFSSRCLTPPFSFFARSYRSRIKSASILCFISTDFVSFLMCNYTHPMKKSQYYKAVQEGIQRARYIRKDLANTETEYFPEKVRGLNKAYIGTIKEIMRQGNLYLDNNPDFWVGLEVAQIVENYSAFLSTIDASRYED